VSFALVAGRFAAVASVLADDDVLFLLAVAQRKPETLNEREQISRRGANATNKFMNKQHVQPLHRLPKEDK
jgi:hypothetical protein